MITQIEINGFKTFKDFKVELAPFQVIVGPNGSGKSNLFDALHPLSRLAEYDVQTAFQDLRGDASDQFTKYADGSRSEKIRFAVEMLLNRTVQNVKRTAQAILIAYDRISIEALEPIVIKKPANISHLDKCILYAAQETSDYHALIVHSDTDDRSHIQTLIERYYPGYTLVQQDKSRACKTLIPIIPVRMVEAWMLGDPEALQTALKNINFIS